MDRLALLVPAYNAANFLRRLLQSAARQTVPFDEIWVFDDCSTDGTSEIAKSFGAQVVRGEENRGCSYGKNALLDNTQCNWVHFHDADDALKQNFVERCHQWMKRQDLDVVLFAYEYRDDTDNALILTRIFDKKALEIDPLDYAIKEVINPFCGLYRRQRVLEAGGYDTDPNVLYNEDAAFHISLALSGLRFSADPEPLVINYRRAGSMSAGNQAKCTVHRWNVLKKAERACAPKYDRVIGEQLWKNAIIAATFDEWRAADSSALLASRLAPPPHGLFGALAWVSPRHALRIREYFIRLCMPYRRAHLIKG